MRMSNKRKVKKMSARDIWGGAILMFAGMMASASAQTDPSKIKIENLTSFNTESIQKKVVELTPAAFSAHLGAGKYVLWTYVDAMGIGNGRNYCVAHVGLTLPATGGRNARIPKTRQVNTMEADKRGQLSAEEWDDCKGKVLLDAITALGAGDDWDTLAREADAATPESGARKRVAADFTKYYVTTIGNAKGIDMPEAFAEAFDRRELQTVVMSTATVIGDRTVCFANAGVAARAPDNRQPRFPGYSYSRLVTQPAVDKSSSAGAEAMRRCEMEAAQSAVNDMLESSWDQNGMLKNLPLTREDGVPLVTKRRPAKPAPPARTVDSTSNQRNALTCHNECVNGSCLRTFSDGRKERWQAPRIFNPLKNDWEWQVNSCGN
jgi:hypothetical protein